MFSDRTDAGMRLAKALDRFRAENCIVLAIPRGGAEVGYRVADSLGAPFSLIISRKLPFPDDPEAGFGAVSEDGSTWMVPGARNWLRMETIEKIKADQLEEIRRRIGVLREGRELPDIRGRAVILVDDGIAMGSTMRASVACCRNLGAAKVVVAVPVTGRETVREMESIADEVVVLEIPGDFRAVAQVYENWYDVPDEEVLEIMAREEVTREREKGKKSYRRDQ
jgi:putative phosphoribosyl transferase